MYTTPSLSYLELLVLPDPDLNLGVGVPEARSAEERHLLDFRQRVRVLCVDLLVVHSLCGRVFYRIINGSRGESKQVKFSGAVKTSPGLSFFTQTNGAAFIFSEHNLTPTLVSTASR